MTAEPNTDALVATVREALRVPTNYTETFREALAALDTLATELEQYEKVKKHYDGSGYTASWERASLMAELERVRAERDEQQRRIEDLEEGAWPWEWVIATRERERWKVAEARLDRAVEALREIKGVTGLDANGPVRTIARAALTEIEEKP